MIDLAPRYLEEVRKLLAEHLPDAEVWVFGSRVSATAAEGSDLDLVVRSFDDSVTPLAGLREAFRESSLPFVVELLDWATIPEHFRKEILKNYQVIKKGQNGPAH